MSIKMVAIALVLVAILVAAVGYVAHLEGDNSGYARGHKEYTDYQTTVASERGTAEANARKAQAAEDAAELAAYKAEAAKQAGIAASVGEERGAAVSRVNQLTAQLTELRKHDPTVQAWYDRCLPSAVLAGLHGGDKANAGTCRW